jgi:hypothetical protein
MGCGTLLQHRTKRSEHEFLLSQAKRTFALEKDLFAIKNATHNAGPAQKCRSYTMPIIVPYQCINRAVQSTRAGR